MRGKTEEGWWHSCSGCHETIDGHETGHFPFSDKHNCYLGAGCDECDGVGAVWFDAVGLGEWCDEEARKMGYSTP